MNFPNPSQRKVLLDQMGHPVMEVVIDKKALSLLFILKIRPRPISPFSPLARAMLLPTVASSEPKTAFHRNVAQPPRIVSNLNEMAN